MLNFIEYGCGQRSIVMLHGFLGSGRNLATLGARLATANAALKVVLPDHLGHGRSPPLPANPTLASLSEAIVDFCREQRLNEPLTLIGHSLGGRVALDLWQRHEDLVEQVVLLDIPPGQTVTKMTDHEVPVFDTLLAAPSTTPTRQAMASFFASRGLSSSITDWLLMNLEAANDGYRWRFDREALAQLNDQGATIDLWPSARAHASRLTAIRGADSPYVSDHDFARLRDAGARVVTIANAGHFLHVDQPAALLSAIEEALG